MNLVRVLYRLFFFALYTTRIVAEVFWRRSVLGAGLPELMLVRRRWARRLLAGVGVEITTSGQAPGFPCLMVANHRSYIDPILILRDVDAFPVAKAELADWPVLGKGAKWAGILYVQRERGESRTSTLRAIPDTILQKKFPVILFPEGTTSDLPGMLPFKRGALRTATKWELPVVPAAICFADPADYWIGDVSFLAHAWKRFQQPVIRVHLSYGPVLQTADPEALEHDIRSWIEAELNRRQTAFSPITTGIRMA